MDPFESLDGAAARMNDPIFTAAVAEVNTCYAELLKPGDSKIIFDRLKKASAIVNKKIAERDAKRETESGLDKVTYKKKMDEDRDRQVTDYKETLKEVAHRAKEGDLDAEHLVQAKKELERATGKKAEDIFKSFFSH